MVITASAFYQEYDSGVVKEKLRASVNVETETLDSEEAGRALARNMFTSMALPIKGGKKACG